MHIDIKGLVRMDIACDAVNHTGVEPFGSRMVKQHAMVRRDQSQPEPGYNLLSDHWAARGNQLHS